MTYYKRKTTHGTEAKLDENSDSDIHRPRSVANPKLTLSNISSSQERVLSDRTNFISAPSVVDPLQKKSGNVKNEPVGKENIPPVSVRNRQRNSIGTTRLSAQMSSAVHISEDSRPPADPLNGQRATHKIADKKISLPSVSKTATASHRQDPSLAAKLKSTTNTVLEKKPPTHTDSKQQQQHKQYIKENPTEFRPDATEEEKQGVTEFFKDNEERYPARSKMEPVPILPIAVPERLKRRFAMDTKTQKVMRVADITADDVDPSRYVNMRDLTNTISVPSTTSRTTVKTYNDNLSVATPEQGAAFRNFLLRQATDTRADGHPNYVEVGRKYPILHQSNNDEIFEPGAPPLRLVANQPTVDTDRRQREHSNRKHVDYAKKAMLATSESFTDEQIKDPMMVAEYVDDIYDYLYETEPLMLPDGEYVKVQSPEFSWNMRSILVDWVIEIHFLFGLMPETLFLAVNIIDRFLSVRQIALGKMQLVGLTALFIASKFEELASPLINDYLHMTDDNYTETQMKEAERFILDALDFKLLYPHPLNFIRRICSKEDFNDINVRTLAKYFAEISCLEEKLIAVRPSKIAAASVWLANKMLAQQKWKGSYRIHSGYATSELKETVEVMLDYLSRPDKHPAFFNKWKQDNVSKASLFVDEWLKKYYKH